MLERPCAPGAAAGCGAAEWGTAWCSAWQDVIFGKAKAADLPGLLFCL